MRLEFPIHLSFFTDRKTIIFHVIYTDTAETSKLQRIAERQKSFQAKYKKTLSKMEAENEAKVNGEAERRRNARILAVMRFKCLRKMTLMLKVH